MNFKMTERSAHPSRAQVIALLEFLEAHPNLAKGFAKTGPSREMARKHWERLTVQLNGIGGSAKTWKQWNKYWADKKSAVKKKTTLHFAAPPRADGFDEIELTDLEHRILALMTGGNCVANKQLVMNPFSGYAEENSYHNPPSAMAQQKASLDARVENKKSSENVSLADINSLDYAEENSYHNPPSAMAQQTATLDARVEIKKPSENLSLPDNNMLDQITPSMKGVHPSMPHCQGVSNRQRAHNTLPQCRRKPTPQSERLSKFNQITDRFLRLKEKRLHQNHRNVQLLEGVNLMAEKQLLAMNAIARGLDAIGEGLKMLADSNKCKNCDT